METELTDNIIEDLVEDENKSSELDHVPKSNEENVVQEDPLPFSYPVYQCENPWILICSSAEEKGKGPGFFKGCKWSPDGTCLLTCTNDNILKLIDLPADLYRSNNLPYQGCGLAEINSALKIKEGELIYDYCWHPHMSSWNPETCL